MEILDETNCKFREIVLHSLEIPSPKMKTSRNSIWFFFISPGNSTSFSGWLLEFPHIIADDAELAESNLTNFGNLVEPLWHRVQVRNQEFFVAGEVS